MGKKTNRQPKTQARHDKNVRKSSKGKFKTAAELQAQQQKTRAANIAAKKKKEPAVAAG